MNTQKGFSTLLGLVLVLAIVGGGAYWYADSLKIETTIEQATDEVTAVDEGRKEKTNEIATTDAISAQPVILDIRGTRANPYVSLDEQVIITGTNFLSGKNLSVYLRPSIRPAGTKYVLPIQQSSDASLTVLVPDGIEESMYGGYDLVVENSAGLAVRPINVVLRPSNTAGEDVDMALTYVLPTYKIGDTVRLKYRLGDLYKGYPALVDLKHLSSGKVFKYGYTKAGLPHEYEDDETVSFVLKDYPDDGVMIQKGEYELCIWLSTREFVQDCAYGSIQIE